MSKCPEVHHLALRATREDERVNLPIREVVQVQHLVFNPGFSSAHGAQLDGVTYYHILRSKFCVVDDIGQSRETLTTLEV